MLTYIIGMKNGFRSPPTRRAKAPVLIEVTLKKSNSKDVLKACLM